MLFVLFSLYTKQSITTIETSLYFVSLHPTLKCFRTVFFRTDSPTIDFFWISSSLCTRFRKRVTDHVFSTALKTQHNNNSSFNNINNKCKKNQRVFSPNMSWLSLLGFIIIMMIMMIGVVILNNLCIKTRVPCSVSWTEILSLKKLRVDIFSKRILGMMKNLNFSIYNVHWLTYEEIQKSIRKKVKSFDCHFSIKLHNISIKLFKTM